MTATLAIRREPGRPRPRRTEVLAVGPWHEVEFTAATAGLKALQTCPSVASVDEACDRLTTAEMAPELILLAQSLPGGVRQWDVDRLQRLAPLARVVIVAGSWCEGELRTGAPPVGALRLYWYELAPWWRAAERRLAAGLCPAWSAPLDHPRAGRFAVDATIDVLKPPSLLAIHADDVAVFESWADAVATAVWTRGDAPPGATAGIWDGGQLTERELERLRRFCRQVAGPVVALLDFPRVEHIALAQAAGATSVFGKPYIVEEIRSALQASRLVPKPGA